MKHILTLLLTCAILTGCKEPYVKSVKAALQEQFPETKIENLETHGPKEGETRTIKLRAKIVFPKDYYVLADMGYEEGRLAENHRTATAQPALTPEEKALIKEAVDLKWEHKYKTRVNLIEKSTPAGFETEIRGEAKVSNEFGKWEVTELRVDKKLTSKPKSHFEKDGEIALDIDSPEGQDYAKYRESYYGRRNELIDQARELRKNEEKAIREKELETKREEQRLQEKMITDRQDAFENNLLEITKKPWTGIWSSRERRGNIAMVFTAANKFTGGKILFEGYFYDPSNTNPEVRKPFVGEIRYDKESPRETTMLIKAGTDQGVDLALQGNFQTRTEIAQSVGIRETTVALLAAGNGLEIKLEIINQGTSLQGTAIVQDYLFSSMNTKTINLAFEPLPKGQLEQGNTVQGNPAQGIPPQEQPPVQNPTVNPALTNLETAPILGGNQPAENQITLDQLEKMLETQGFTPEIERIIIRSNELADPINTRAVNALNEKNESALMAAILEMKRVAPIASQTIIWEMKLSAMLNQHPEAFRRYKILMSYPLTPAEKAVVTDIYKSR